MWPSSGWGTACSFGWLLSRLQPSPAPADVPRVVEVAARLVRGVLQQQPPEQTRDAEWYQHPHNLRLPRLQPPAARAEAAAEAGAVVLRKRRFRLHVPNRAQ